MIAAEETVQSSKRYLSAKYRKYATYILPSPKCLRQIHTERYLEDMKVRKTSEDHASLTGHEFIPLNCFKYLKVN